MAPGYIIISLLMIGLFGTTYLAAQQGWGLNSDAAARAQAKSSVRTGSARIGRTYYGGGPGFGK
jgi:hypothetical protein